ncbi:WecB/TagA/CpsF family glycosyltransferase [Bradyrhizobium sp. 24]|uniref:WecB/TagA/CpsF family glycosyltransferase n=1 Tax=unclassified Bradyrhizobium TaxID=2631580 RepID=UPI001FFB6177|nr:MULTISPECIES: WecB/TagA/CpsF family glycosyltransferase [unclassified Bradyrhizobium]MCK1297311.1 WecB/TagA/CpsF family glycosyltransferase [Bradyrhizobium sp. 37]MCK1378007.1 WecB/TagA/CpsF family glycosyltransferase [Bradyrhizobium sp. 24]MCK1769317.1 WecB/TagA/CpsF family glycosyltransferase [Bradyrhizobium sp. 134]
MEGHSGKLPAASVLGVPISLINMQLAVREIVGRAKSRTSAYVCVRDVHGIMRAQDDPELRRIHEGADIITPDGMPLVWICRWKGHSQISRVCGPDLVDEVCRSSVPLGLRHYFYGGKPGVAERMTAKLIERYPGLIVAGIDVPPFGALLPKEDEEYIARINKARPDIVWVGLSTPKQEYWMRDHVRAVPGTVLIGVGAAFDFHAGDVRRAPIWMQSSGLEWFFRLLCEPRRLWRRYLVLAPMFVVQVFRNEVVRLADHLRS